MHITLSPRRSDDLIAISKQGDTLTINGEILDFSVIPEGAILPASAVSGGYFTGNITRTGGELSLTLTAPHSKDPSPAAAFPEPLNDVQDGVLELPQ